VICYEIVLYGLQYGFGEIYVVGVWVVWLELVVGWCVVGVWYFVR